MTERERAMFEGRIVTVLDGKIGRRIGKATIRDRGFVKEVRSNELAELPEDDPERKFSFESPED